MLNSSSLHVRNENGSNVLSKQDVQMLAQFLDDATCRAQEVERLALQFPGLHLTVEQGYEIQKEGTQLRLGRGEKLLGYKMGLTSEAKRKQMNLDSPVYGPLTDQMRILDSATFSLQGSIHPKIEPEIAFRTKIDLSGKIDLEEALQAIDLVYPALEILDSRYKDFKYFSLPEVIADNCSSSYFILAQNGVNPQGLDLAQLQMKFMIDGNLMHQAVSREISGNPVLSLVQLCEMLGAHGRILPAGSIVLAGAATQAVTLQKGMKIQIEVESLGSASVVVV